MIREAECRDIETISELLIDFYREADCFNHVSPNKKRLREFIEMMIVSDAGGVAVVEEKGEIFGTCGMLYSPHWFNLDHKQAQELWWYIKPAFRGKPGGAIKLFRYLERWPKDHGCDSVVVGSTSTLGVDRVEEFYIKRGFGKSDVFYCKGVQ